MSKDVRSLVVARIAETQEALILTLQELKVIEKITKEELKESQEYLDFYSILISYIRVCGF